MDQPLIATARLRLLSKEVGGRKTALRTDYRPLFELPATRHGAPAQGGGRVMLVDREELSPGDEGTVTIIPIFPEVWGTLRAGLSIPVLEGAHIVGYARITDVTRAEHFTPAVTSFVCRAREYCTFVRDASKSPLPDRLRTARQLLLALYTAALDLPDIESSSDQAEPPAAPPKSWQDFDAFETYWEVFDPYESTEPVAGSLSEDLLDIYADVRAGLWQWEHDGAADAVWGWRFSFESHWGDHAVDALRAIHRACRA